MKEQFTLQSIKEKRDEIYKINVKIICDFIDNFIGINYAELLKRPMICRIPDLYCDGDMYLYIKEIEGRYKDFTVQLMGSVYYTSIRIKLADKDWDWNGYGIKPTPTLQPPTTTKKSFFKKLF